jgi:DNA-binding response OmpR family regulator
MKLLAVDDDPQVLKFIKTLLETRGYEVLALSDSRSAMKSVEREEFGAALLGADTPHGDWLAVAQHIRASSPNANTPVVMLTAFADVDTMRAAFKVGVTCFVQKPIDSVGLASILNAMKGRMLKERNVSIRLPVQRIVACRTGQSEFKALSRDISESGMLLDVPGKASEGQEMEMRFSLPAIPWEVNARATVVRVDPLGRVGVKFDTFEGPALKAIRGYISGTFQD